MNKIAKLLAAGLSLTVLAGAAAAQVIGKPEDQIRWRQSAMHTMAWSMGRIKANVQGTYNKEQVAEAANVVQAIANAKIGALFQPGSDKGKGWKDTRVKPEFFSDKEGVGKAAGAFNKAANDLAKAAASGDQLAVTEQFDNINKACKGCHDKFQKE